MHKHTNTCPLGTIWGVPSCWLTCGFSPLEQKIEPPTLQVKKRSYLFHENVIHMQSYDKRSEHTADKGRVSKYACKCCNSVSVSVSINVLSWICSPDKMPRTTIVSLHTNKPVTLSKLFRLKCWEKLFSVYETQGMMDEMYSLSR